MQQTRDYITESHDLGKSYASMSRETGLSVYKLKQGNVPYEVKRDIYRRSAYSFAKSKGLSVEESSLIRRGTYKGNKLSTVEEITYGRKRTLDINDLKSPESWYDKTAKFMKEKWNRENELKYKRRLEHYNSLSPKEKQEYIKNYTKQYGRSPIKKFRPYSDKDIRKILSKKLGDYTEEEFELKLTQT